MECFQTKSVLLMSSLAPFAKRRDLENRKLLILVVRSHGTAFSGQLSCRYWWVFLRAFPSIILHRSISFSPVCGTLSLLNHQYHQTWAVWLEAVTCQWGDRCLRARHSHSCHSCSHSCGLRKNLSSRIHTCCYQVMLHPSMTSLMNHVTPTIHTHRRSEKQSHDTHT